MGTGLNRVPPLPSPNFIYTKYSGGITQFYEVSKVFSVISLVRPSSAGQEYDTMC